MCTNNTPKPVSSSNQIVYQRLKQALTINLRRQIFIAVCDDLYLRNCLAAHLQSELLEADFLLSTGTKITPKIPPLVTLSLNINTPYPFHQIHQWFAENPPSEEFIQSGQVLKFQLLGIEELTRQPAFIQWSFLSHLREIEQYFHQLNFSLLLWVSQPWLYSIQQSAPEFWCWYTGVFHFEGEPTPAFFTPSDFLEVKEFLPVLSQEDHSASEDQPNFQKKGKLSHSYSESIPDHKNLPEIQNFLDLLENFDFSQFMNLVKLTAINFDQSQSETPIIEELEPIEMVNLLQFLQENHQENELIIETYFHLAKFYHRRITITENPPQYHWNQLILALCCYEQILPILPENQELSSPSPRDFFGELGSLYRLLSRLPESRSRRANYLEKSIFYYEQLLHYLDQDDNHHIVKIYQNIGICYGELAPYQIPIENWQKAILSYQQALLYLHPDQAHSSAMTLENNRGTAYWNLAQYSRPIEHLKNAIAAYHKALLFCDQEQEPINYGGIQNNLGTAYWNLAQHQPSKALLIKAIDAYREALKYRTSEKFPLSYISTQNNLGTAYWHLANQSQSYQGSYECLQKSIKAYEETLKIAQQFSPEQLPFDRLATHNNLGSAYYQLATHGIKSSSQKEQISQLQSALFHQIQAYLGEKKQLKISSKLSQTPPPSDSTTLNGIIKTVRAFYTQGGIPGQNLALSQIPGDLLSEILPRL